MANPGTGRLLGNPVTAVRWLLCATVIAVEEDGLFQTTRSTGVRSRLAN